MSSLDALLLKDQEAKDFLNKEISAKLSDLQCVPEQKIPIINKYASLVSSLQAFNNHVRSGSRLIRVLRSAAQRVERKYRFLHLVTLELQILIVKKKGNHQSTEVSDPQISDQPQQLKQNKVEVNKSEDVSATQQNNQAIKSFTYQIPQKRGNQVVGQNRQPQANFQKRNEINNRVKQQINNVKENNATKMKNSSKQKYQKQEQSQQKSQLKDELGRISIFCRIEKPQTSQENNTSKKEVLKDPKTNEKSFQASHSQEDTNMGENPRKIIKKNALTSLQNQHYQKKGKIQESQSIFSQNNYHTNEDQSLQNKVQEFNQQNIINAQVKQMQVQIGQGVIQQQNYPSINKCANGLNCPYGSSCKFWHAPSETPCKFGLNCQRMDCAFYHQQARKISNKTWVNPNVQRANCE